MCLAALAIRASERFPLVLIANRDEAFDRPTAPLAWWTNVDGRQPVLSGRDLVAGGTWLGLSPRGRLALVTNVRDPQVAVPPGAPSRGLLVRSWLQASSLDAPLAETLITPRAGFNLIALNLAAALTAQEGVGLWLSNRAPQPQQLLTGVVGVSNALLDTPWPKLLALKAALTRLLVDERTAPAEQTPQLFAQLAFAALGDRRVAPDDVLPNTGIALARERALSAACVRVTGPDGRLVYGTRCSTVVLLERTHFGGTVRVIERSFDAVGEPLAPDVHVNFDLPTGATVMAA